MTFPDNVPLDTPAREWPDCPVCGAKRGKVQKCKNACDTWTANPVGTPHGVGWMSTYTTRGGPRGQIAESEI